jgi:hypothetical protein
MRHFFPIAAALAGVAALLFLALLALEKSGFSLD